MTIPLDTSVEAVYADGFILNETIHNDISPYNSQQNILRAIIDKHPEKEHGVLVLFSVFFDNLRYDIDWSTLPDNARPIRFKHFERKAMGGDWLEEPQIVKLQFGYQYTDKNGKNIQEVRELIYG